MDRWQSVTVGAGAAAVEQAHMNARAKRATSCADATDGGSVSIHVEARQRVVQRLRMLSIDYETLRLRRVNTPHVLVSDADFLPSRGLRDAIRAKAHWLANDKLALVVPAFQRKGRGASTPASSRAPEPLPTTVPGRFASWRVVCERRTCLVFQGDNSPQSRGTTDSSRWLEGRR